MTGDPGSDSKIMAVSWIIHLEQLAELAWWEGSWSVSTAGVPRNVLVTNIRFGSFPGRTRVVIDMKETPRSTRLNHSKDHRQLDVRVDQ